MGLQATQRWGRYDLAIAACTDTGRKRARNEDAFLVCDDEPLLVVADGMGGYEGGAEASDIAVRTMESFFKATREDEDGTWPYKLQRDRSYQENRLVSGMRLSNRRIFERASSTPNRRRMGTTIVGILFGHRCVHIGHVGDSRVYRYRAGELALLTQDHSLLNDWIRMTHPTEEEIGRFPHRNVVVRALGIYEQVQVEVTDVGDVVAGDLYLLCSDGLSGMLDGPVIAGILDLHASDLAGACDALIVAANEAGGIDNITAVLARVS